MARIVVLANCKAGAGADQGARTDAILAAFAATKAVPEVVCVAPHEMGDAAKAIAAERPAAIAAAGGDGTVSTVAGALAGTRVPLAVLPLGTLNHFAKDVGVPLGLEAAAAVAANGDVAAVDVGEVNGNVFVNNASIGVYPRAVKEREELRRARPVAKHWAMAQASWSVLQRLPAHRVRLTIDGRPIVRRTPFVFVGNNSYETGFGRLGRRAALNQGHLGVYHALRPDRRAILALAARALVGRLHTSSDLQSQTAQRLTIESSHPTMRVAIDGELRRLDTPLQFRTRPGDLLVKRPRGSP